eukprot:scaffold17759_cov67-Phaeocystis_antarctica.AAC.1
MAPGAEPVVKVEALLLLLDDDLDLDECIGRHGRDDARLVNEEEGQVISLRGNGRSSLHLSVEVSVICILCHSVPHKVTAFPIYIRNTGSSSAAPTYSTTGTPLTTTMRPPPPARMPLTTAATRGRGTRRCWRRQRPPRRQHRDL